jgi:hypothetical protein
VSISRKHSSSRCLVFWISLTFLATLGIVHSETSGRASKKSQTPQGPDQNSFLSVTAVSEDSPGTPVGPPKKVIICHNGHTIRVPEKAVQAHLGHGDYLGPCSNQVVICHKYINYDNPEHYHIPNRTIIVSERDLPQYLAMGDTLGPCSNQVFMCNNHNRTIVVSDKNINDHLSQGHQMGLCPGKTMICHKGKTIVVSSSSVPEHLAHGDCLGYCYGSAGPLVYQTAPPCTSSPDEAVNHR